MSKIFPILLDMGQRTHMTWTNATYMITANATEVYRPPERKTCVYNI